MLKLIIPFTFILLSSLLPTTQAANIQYNNNQIIGVENVAIDGSLWTATFLPYAEYLSAGSPLYSAQFAEASITELARLLDNEFRGTNFDRQPGIINGCTDITFCELATLISFDATDATSYVHTVWHLDNFAALEPAITHPHLETVKYFFSNPPSLAYAKWTLQPPPADACPCSVWSDTDIPANTSATDANAVELGVKFMTDVDGYISAIRYYQGVGNTGEHRVNLWSTEGGNPLATATAPADAATGWKQVNFDAPVAVLANTVYVASYHAPNGHYANNPGFFATAGFDKGHIHLLQDGVNEPNGVYSYGPTSTMPISSFQSANYWVDVVFDLTETQDTIPPNVLVTSPTNGALNVPKDSVVTAQFDEDIASSSLTDTSFILLDDLNFLVSATVTFDGSKTLTLTPDIGINPLTYGKTYTAIIDTSVTDLAGNPMAAEKRWSFTIIQEPGVDPVCPCSAWSDTDIPTNTSEVDANAVELGVKFMTDVDGYISAIRYYQGAGNTGVHTVNLWAIGGGAPLATANSTVELDAGWKQVNFDVPVEIFANTIYVASYFAPNGHYANDNGFFSAAGFDNGYIHLLQDSVNEPNGVYAYGPASTFPFSSYQSTNYWVDVVFDLAQEAIPPNVLVTSPTDGALNVPSDSVVTAQFDENIAAASLTTTSFILLDDVNLQVPATVTFDGSKTLTLTPDSGPLAFGKTYTAVIDTSVTDLAGNPMAAEKRWSFTTAQEPIVCPCSIWSDTDIPTNTSEVDANAVELGVKFMTDVDGFISAIRYYQGVGNTGMHTVNLWAIGGGAALATATAPAEAGTGWKQVNFDAPVAVSANTVYVASYYAPNGHYANDNGFFSAAGVDNGHLHLLQDGVSEPNGVYSYGPTSTRPISSYLATNYWVDVVFTTE